MKSYSKSVAFTLVVALLCSLQTHAQLSVTGEPELLISSETLDFMKPVWSPDGNYIAYTSARNIGLWITNVEDETTTQITEETAGFGFLWSQDSQSILARVSTYENRRRKHAVTVYDVSSKEAARITDFRNEMPTLPKWTNADQNIVLISDNNIESFESGKPALTQSLKQVNQRFYVLKSGSIASGRIPDNATSDISPFDDAQYINLELSPDGMKLAFEVYGGNLYVMNIDGSGLKDLGRASRPKWSPDGAYIVAMVATDDGYNYESSDIYAFGVLEDARINLTASTDLVATNPSWSPGGSKIAFDSPQTGNIYLLSISNQ